MNEVRQADVVIIIASKSDEKFVKQSNKKGDPDDVREVLLFCGITSALTDLSAHRHPLYLAEYCQSLRAKVVAAAASGSAGLPGAIAGLTDAQIPILGVALPRTGFEDGRDALASMLYMPPGTPVAVCGVGEWGMRNAMIVAAQIIARTDPEVARKLIDYRVATNKPHHIEYEVM